MLAFGAGGIDVAVAMGGGTLILPRPEIIEVNLTGKLNPWCAAKDVILELLRRLTNWGGVGKMFEYTGKGVATLTLAERFTIASMGTELGLTGSLFSSDERTKEFFERTGRANEWKSLSAETDPVYDGRIDIDLSDIEPLIALPSNPDNVVPVSEAAGTPIEQVVSGSCTNGSFSDIAAFAQILRGRKVAEELDAIVFPGSRQAFEDLARQGHIADLLAAGVLVSESTCGSCPGYGHVPAPGTKSLRTFNRNFRGRSGLREDAVYLCSTETAAVSAIRGVITDPRDESDPPEVLLPYRFAADRTGVIPPSDEPDRIELLRSPNIAPIPAGEPFGDSYEGEVLIKLGDSISTDDIIPAGVEAITYRTNAPALAEYVFRRVDPEFTARAHRAGGGIIVGGDIYGQGSAREQAALCPMLLGVRVVLAKSFARIHRANLINWGILPLQFNEPSEWDRLAQGQHLRLTSLREGLSTSRLRVENMTSGHSFETNCTLTTREQDIILAGGVLAHTKAGT
jgi:aconitate hydratase